MDGWIKIHRQMLFWEWYNDNNVKILFLHLLLTANHKDQRWKGITIKRGQKLTSIKHLAEETNLTGQQVRTALNKLKLTGEITIQVTNKYSLITVEKYSVFQDSVEENNKQNNNQDNNQITTNKNDKNIYNIYNNINNNNIDNINNIKKENIKRKKFIPPTLDEIQNYIIEKQLTVDAKHFYDYFMEGGWIDSKGNKVKNWKQKLLTWNKYSSKDKKQNYEFDKKQENLDFLYD